MPIAPPFTVDLPFAVDPTTSAPITVNPLRNLYVGGAAGSGATHAIQGIAVSALHAGWRVRVLNAKSHEYDDLAADHAPDATDRYTSLYGPDPDTFASMVLDTRPGTPGEPLLLVLDGGIVGQFDTSGPWLRHLLRAMSDPNTGVVIRTQLATKAVLPAAVFRECGARLLPGVPSSVEYWRTFDVRVFATDTSGVPNLRAHNRRGAAWFRAALDANVVPVRIPSNDERWGNVPDAGGARS